MPGHSPHLVYFFGCVLKEEEGMWSSCRHQGEKGTCREGGQGRGGAGLQGGGEEEQDCRPAPWPTLEAAEGTSRQQPREEDFHSRRKLQKRIACQRQKERAVLWKLLYQGLP